jgi:AcrR family transcriptional regulator
MLTPRRERLKQELRDDILSAARDLFVHEGYESVSIRKVADRCGCAPGTIYLHFEDKDAIMAAICLETFEKLDRRMEAIRNDTAGDPVDRLRRGGRQYAQFALDHPQHYIVTFGVAPHASGRNTLADNPAAHQAGMQSFACLQDLVQKCIDAGRLRLTDVQAVSQSLWAAMHGVVMLLITKQGFPFIEHTRLVETVLDICMEGILAS